MFEGFVVGGVSTSLSLTLGGSNVITSLACWGLIIENAGKL